MLVISRAKWLRCITTMMMWRHRVHQWATSLYSFYKHMVKHEVTKMRDILTSAQKYIQIEDATRSSANCSPSEGRSREIEGATCSSEEDSERGGQSYQQPRSEPLQEPWDEANFTPFKVFMDQVYVPSRTMNLSGTQSHSSPTRRDREPENIVSSTTA